MTTCLTRDLTAAEEAHIEDVLGRLREHFHEWCSPQSQGYEYDLAAFAYYEGCPGRDESCGAILAEAAPFALGRELVARHGFHWVMLGGGDTGRYAVMHPSLAQPIELLALDDGS